MVSYSNQKILEKEPPKFSRGICWFCKNACKNSSYAHEECMIDYFREQKQHQLVKA